MQNKKMVVYGIVLTIAFVGQIILAFLYYDPEGNATRINIGWGVLMLSAIFGWLPIFTFRKKGGVEGKSYINTTVLVDTGIYGVVRHPQYLAGILLNVALPLITPHWTVTTLGLIASTITCLNTFDEEKGCIEKFGEDYRRYMEEVPRLNFISGTLRSIRRRKG
ncbi:MAG: isoprenylcysteine carboxylmethyltransferase family protein [Anaerolineaceae bacterium]|nr:isoprenylcysteine carboxylmethyltransferase family protein [Anaerolineaceae bacterium]